MSQSDLLSPSLVAHPELMLQISNLNHWFGHGDTHSQVLDDLNLEIYQGEIVILLGPSGSGKQLC